MACCVTGVKAESLLSGIIADMPENSWQRVNRNQIRDVFTPFDQLPSATLGTIPISPQYIIDAWGGAAWDHNRGDLIVYGGEASAWMQFASNEVYRWRSSTLMWERASLPSEVRVDEYGEAFAVDGPEYAPFATESFDGLIFAPVADRLGVFLGGQGPYLWDPAKAAANKVGGSDGSHVSPDLYPDVTGGYMWENRDNPEVERLADLYFAHTTDAAVIDGKDVVFYHVNGSGTRAIQNPGRLLTYTIHDVNDRTKDEWRVVGKRELANVSQGAGAYAPDLNIFLSVRDFFNFWDLDNPGPDNPSIRVRPEFIGDDIGNIPFTKLGVAYDRANRQFVLWSGNRDIYLLTPPENITADGLGWTLEKLAPSGDIPSASNGTGILGKWNYMPNEGAFVGVANGVTGDIWVYKPVADGAAPLSVLTGSLPATEIASDYEFTLLASGGEPPYAWRIVQGDLPAGIELGADGRLFGAALEAGSFPVRFEVTDGMSTMAQATLTLTVGAASNLPPTIRLVQPANGTGVLLGDSIALQAEASDDDGFIERVVFVADGQQIGVLTEMPYVVQWTPGAVGNVVLEAIATDDAGDTASTTAVVNVVADQEPEEIDLYLQQGVDGYLGTRDTYLNSAFPGTVLGASSVLVDGNRENWGGGQLGAMVRFAVFASEGGPVPDGATVTSAVLSLYKSSYYSSDYRLHEILVEWSEDEATWAERRSGAAWTQPGATGLGSDLSAEPVAQRVAGWTPGWVDFDVTSSLQAMSRGDVSNRGWRLLTDTVNYNHRRFHAREYVGDPMLRPLLQVAYSYNGASVGNQPPAAAITSPVNGAQFAVGAAASIEVDATDADGTVVRVDFYIDGELVATDDTAPWTIDWIPAAAGSFELQAVATDDDGAEADSVPVNVSAVEVTDPPASAEVVLKQGFDGYQGTFDTYLSSGFKDVNFGGRSKLWDGDRPVWGGSDLSAMWRFAIFESEGGPVPDGARIRSATLGLYKSSYYHYDYDLHAVLVPWAEDEATWHERMTGEPWSQPGGRVFGVDLSAEPDAQSTASWQPGWLDFDVTDAVQAISDGTRPNYGWRLIGISGYMNYREFVSREATSDPSLRPELIIDYEVSSP